MRQVILTGDDFGYARSVNEAVEEAHLNETLTTASLMMSGTATADAVERARRLPSLAVGLHLVLVVDRPLLPRDVIPALTGPDGDLPSNLVIAGFRFFLRRDVRRQLELEVRAQFEAFAETGLRLDHVNTHNHIHIHPTVLSLLLRVGREFGMKAVRLPWEPPILSWRATRRRLGGRLLQAAVTVPWIAMMRSKLRTAGIAFNEFLFGMSESGRMTAETTLQLLRSAPDGVSEFHFHPAKRRQPELDRTMPDYHHVEEHELLAGDTLREELSRQPLARISFGELSHPPSPGSTKEKPCSGYC